MNTLYKRIMPEAAIPVLILILMLGGCRHKELDTDPLARIRVRVEFDWRNAPEGEQKAAAMAVFFYHPATGECHRFDFAGNQGGYVELAPGEWNVVTYNTDTPGILFGSTGVFEAHEAYTRPGNLLEGALGNLAAYAPRSAEEENVVITPDELWGITSRRHAVYPDPASGEAVVTLFPEPLVCHYSYEIRNVVNAEHISQACGTLSGMSGRLAFHRQALDPTNVTLPFSSKVNNDNTITGEFFTFGHHEDNPERHTVALYVWLDDGRKLAFGTTRADKWDVTDQIHAAPDRRRVHFIIDGLEIPLEPQNSGFQTTTDDWGEETIEVEVPL